MKEASVSLNLTRLIGHHALLQISCWPRTVCNFAQGLSGQNFAKIDHHESPPTVKTVKEAIFAFTALAGWRRKSPPLIWDADYIEFAPAIQKKRLNTRFLD